MTPLAAPISFQIVVCFSKKTLDNHEDMNNDVFYEWFQESLMPNLTSPLIIVMDNVPHYSKQLDKTPTATNLKSEIQRWFQDHNILFEEDFRKVELLNICKQYKPSFPNRLTLGKAHGHKVLELPPYYCHFNAIIMI